MFFSSPLHGDDPWLFLDGFQGKRKEKKDFQGVRAFLFLWVTAGFKVFHTLLTLTSHVSKAMLS